MQVCREWTWISQCQSRAAVLSRYLCVIWKWAGCCWSVRTKWNQCLQQPSLVYRVESCLKAIGLWAQACPESLPRWLHGFSPGAAEQHQLPATQRAQEEHTGRRANKTRRRAWRPSERWGWWEAISKRRRAWQDERAGFTFNSSSSQLQQLGRLPSSRVVSRFLRVS